MKFLMDKVFAFLSTALVFGFGLNINTNAQELVYNYEGNETVSSIITKEDFSEGFDNQANKINFELARAVPLACVRNCKANCKQIHKIKCQTR